MSIPEIKLLTHSAQEIHDSIRDEMERVRGGEQTDANEQFQIGTLKLLAKIACELEQLNASAASR